MADITNRIAGVVYLKVDGNQYALKGNLTVSPDLIERTGVAGQDGVHGYTEQARVPYISGDISDSAGLSLEDLRAITNSTVTAELANGKQYVLSNAWTADAFELNTAEGQLSVKFEGMNCQEIR